MTDLEQFIRGRLDEDEAVARAAGGATWTYEGGPWGISDETGERVVYDEGAPTESQFEHIARHDPSAVLADIAFKRQLLDASVLMIDKYAGGMLLSYVWHTLKLLAALWGDHEDYDPAWRTQ